MQEPAVSSLQQLRNILDELPHDEQGEFLLRFVEQLPAWLDRVEANVKTGADKEHVEMARRRVAEMHTEMSRRLAEGD
jgi:DNA-directed RNA polymerase specialized sigma24 family protein